MAHGQAEFLDELPRLRRDFHVSRELVAQALDRSKSLIEYSLSGRRLRDPRAAALPAPAGGAPMADVAARVEHLSELTGALLEYSRLSIHFRPSEARMIDVNEIVRDAVVMLETRAVERRQELCARLADGRAFVTGDAARIRRAVVSLVENALTYTPDEGRIQVSVAVAGADVSIAVCDTGRGIEQKQLPGIFEPFGRGSASAPGLGIALALVRRIAEMHGGSVSAVSEGSGRGSLFTLRLPRVGHKRSET